ELYLAPVDWVADAIVAMSLSEDALGDKTTAKAWHYLEEAPVPTHHFSDWLAQEIDGFRTEPWADWLARVARLISAEPDHPAASVLPFWTIIHERGLDRSGAMPRLDATATRQR